MYLIPSKSRLVQNKLNTLIESSGNQTILKSKPNRMNSKMSIMSRSKRAKNRNQIMKKDIAQLKSHSNKLLSFTSDLPDIRNQLSSHTNSLNLVDDTLNNVKNDHNAITEKMQHMTHKQKDIMNTFQANIQKIQKIYSDIKNMVDEFKNEYKHGFK